MFQYVKAHQDDEYELTELPVPAQVNCKIDSLASCQYKQSSFEHHFKAPALRAQGISLSNPY